MKRYTEEQIARADAADLVQYLKDKGVPMTKVGKNYSLKEHDSLMIRDNQWYWFSRQTGGKALSYLTRVEEIPFTEAVKILTGEEGIETEKRPIMEMPEPGDPHDLKLPVPYENNNAMFAYLKARGIDPRIIRQCVDDGILYQSNMYWRQDENGEWTELKGGPQAVFVGKDLGGVERYACTRSCTGDGKHDAPGSEKAYAFCLPDGDSKSLWVYESAIDLLSHCTLCSYSKKRFPTHRVSLGGLSPVALARYLQDYPQVQYVNLALDADEPGRQATEELKKLLEDQYTVYDHPPKEGKDYNEELLAVQARYRERKQEQAKQEGEER